MQIDKVLKKPYGLFVFICQDTARIGREWGRGGCMSVGGGDEEEERLKRREGGARGEGRGKKGTEKERGKGKWRRGGGRWDMEKG